MTINPKTYVPLLFLITITLSCFVIPNPFFINIIINLFYFATLSLAWNILGGYSGQFSLGHAAFMGLGAYTSTLLFLHFNLTPWLGMFIGATFTSVIGALVFWPCFRLKGFYFCLATIAFAEVLRILATHWRSLTKGGVGLLLPVKPSLYNMLFTSKYPYLFISLFLLLLAIAITHLIEKSRLGYSLKALRNDEDGAEAAGVNVFQSKLVAAVISAFLTALGGTFYVQYMLYIEPEIVFSIHQSLQISLFAIIGGIGTIAGPIVGTFLLVPLDIALKGWLGSLYAGLGFIVYGALLIAVVMLIPEGIIKWLGPKLNHLYQKFPKFEIFRRKKEVISSKIEDKPRKVKGEKLLLELKNVHKSFKGLIVLNDISFKIFQGELVGLIGPNGAGKTTLFNVVTKFLPVDSGEIFFNGINISHGKKTHEICSLGISRTFQIVKPFSSLSVIENIQVGALTRIPKPKEAEELAREIVSLCGLEKYSDYAVGNLTLAFRKRLELARALATQPNLLLLDEVMAGLNPREVEDMIHLVETISKRGTTFLIVEHVMQVIMGLCQRVIVLNYGNLIASGTPEEIYHNPEVIEAYLGEVGDEGVC
jgi:branched-chain amino acid transport system permease protein